MVKGQFIIIKREPHIQPLPTSMTMIQDVNRVDAVLGLDDHLWERQWVMQLAETS